MLKERGALRDICGHEGPYYGIYRDSFEKLRFFRLLHLSPKLRNKKITSKAVFTYLTRLAEGMLESEPVADTNRLVGTIKKPVFNPIQSLSIVASRAPLLQKQCSQATGEFESHIIPR